MISTFHVEGFKRIRSHTFIFAPLTVLAGLNGSGKTSLIQAVLLTREASVTDSQALQLNGPFGLQLGTATDVNNWQHSSPIEMVADTTDTRQARWKFSMPEKDDALYLLVDDRPTTSPSPICSRRPRTFIYLSAERLGPRYVMETAAFSDDELELGFRGEYCAHVLSVLGDRIIADPNRSHPDSRKPEARLLKYEAETWLSEMTRPVEINGSRLDKSTVTKLEFRSPGGEWVRAPNMGFGLSYALPIVLGGLTAEAGGLMIVENPEAHLHPAGQSRMGVFLAWLASKGVQILVETHSDHILNGIRRAIAEKRYLPADKAIVHYFAPDGPADEPGAIECLTFNESGSLSDWPAGFFDQYQIDVSSLGRNRRR